MEKCASEFDGHCVSARRFLIWMDRIEEYYYWLVSFFRFEPTLARKQVKMTEKKKKREEARE